MSEDCLYGSRHERKRGAQYRGIRHAAQPNTARDQRARIPDHLVPGGAHQEATVQRRSELSAAHTDQRHNRSEPDRPERSQTGTTLDHDTGRLLRSLPAVPHHSVSVQLRFLQTQSPSGLLLGHTATAQRRLFFLPKRQSPVNR